MTNLTWPVWLDDIWAKSPEEERKPGESLTQHTWLVLKRLSEMIALRPYLPEMVGFSGLWNSLFWACLLHDFGKAAQGFQISLRDGPRWPHRHEVLSLAFLSWLGETLIREESIWTAAAISYHHKDAHKISLRYLDLGDNLQETLQSLVLDIDKVVLEGLWSWLDECVPSWIESLNLASAGVRRPQLIPMDQAVVLFHEGCALSIASHLRGLRRWGREISRLRKGIAVAGTVTLRGHINTCDHTASAHTDPLLSFPRHSHAELLSQMGLAETKLYPHQRDCIKIKGSAVLVAPTGSGKTESALLWACSQANGLKPPSRLFYTLPYQASMNAMYDRLDNKGFPGQVGLDHSRSMLALYRRFLEESQDRKQSVRLARLAKKLSRLHYFPVRVLSPYQMLKAPYQLKGYEALLTDFFGAAFIFDEIHAYDAGRLAAILATARYLRENYGASFFVMSATLSSLVINRLTEALGSEIIIEATQEVFNKFRRHRLMVRDGELLQESWLDKIAEEAVMGSSVLVCCNTVKRAQQAYRELSQRLKGSPEVVLLHGRFNSRDRLDKEKIVRYASGSDSPQRRPVVLVATQVVEVSLDIDLDVIYTDPAPLEALIQRFGRINRRQRWKEGALVNVFREPSDGQGIYKKELVRESLKVLSVNEGKMIDEAVVSDWLNSIYSGDIADSWNLEYQQAYEKFEMACLRSLRPFEADESLEEMFYRAFNTVEVLPASLEGDYKECLEREPLEAGQLLVPLSWRQFRLLSEKGKVWDSNFGPVKVVEAPYDRENGLQLNVYR